jgi:hypothetical protein
MTAGTEEKTPAASHDRNDDDIDLGVGAAPELDDEPDDEERSEVVEEPRDDTGDGDPGVVDDRGDEDLDRALLAAVRSLGGDSGNEGFSDRSLQRNRMAWPRPAHVHPACNPGPPPCTWFEFTVDDASSSVTVAGDSGEGKKSAMIGGEARRRGTGPRQTPARGFFLKAKPRAVGDPALFSIETAAASGLMPSDSGETFSPTDLQDKEHEDAIPSDADDCLSQNLEAGVG